MKKKIFAVSDIHGHYHILKEALDRAGFDDSNDNHLLVCCGDYFDRGDENVEVLIILKHSIIFLCTVGFRPIALHLNKEQMPRRKPGKKQGGFCGQITTQVKNHWQTKQLCVGICPFYTPTNST